MGFEVCIHDGMWEHCIPTSLSLAARHWLSVTRPILIFMGIIDHGWNICLPAFGLGGWCVTFGSGPMSIFAIFAMCTCASPEVDLRVVIGRLIYCLALCTHCACAVQKQPPVLS